MSEAEIRALQARVKELEDANTRLELEAAELRGRLDEESERLEQKSLQLRLSYLGTIQAIARAVEAKDPYTQGHSELVTKYSLALAREVGYPWDQMERIQVAAMLLNVGKIGVPREILCKTEPLTDEETAILRQHVEIGAAIVEPLIYPWDIAHVLIQCRERFDGSGYPKGLSGEQICLEARILGLVDAFCAMITDRAYRGAHTREDAIRHVAENAGTLWDAEIAAAFGRLLARDEEEIFRDLDELVAGPHAR